MMVMAGSMGTNVKSAESSYEAMHTFGCSLIPFHLLNKIIGVLYVMGGVSYQRSQDPHCIFCHLFILFISKIYIAP